MVRPSFDLDAIDLAAAAVEIAHDVALVLVRGDVLDLHDRLEEDRLGLLEAVLDREDGRHLEGEFVGIDVVVAAVDDVDFDIDDRVAADDAVEDGFLDALLDGRDVFLGDGAADDLVLDGETLAALGGADVDDRRGRTGRGRRIA